MSQSQSKKLMPNLDRQSTKVLNLTVLQRFNPFIAEILFTAAHVSFYEFNIETNQWSRKDVEGSLFVVKRNVQPQFQFIVMNRQNTDLSPLSPDWQAKLIFNSHQIEKEAEAKIQGAVKLLKFTGCSKFPFSL
nr:mRNA-decapping enzyme-like protein isoform X2 [Arachis hypogaea]XP_025663344.1 mRNA-decapping enzyme-like protein isoform X3 [Arachis hypogaea]